MQYLYSWSTSLLTCYVYEYCFILSKSFYQSVVTIPNLSIKGPTAWARNKKLQVGTSGIIYRKYFTGKTGHEVTNHTVHFNKCRGACFVG